VAKTKSSVREGHSIKSAKRVIEVFEFFAQRRSPATIGEIAKALDFPQSSTSVLMKCLHDLKYMQRDAQQRTYQPTLRLALTASWFCELQFSGSELTSLMTRLRDQTGGAVVLGIQNGIDLQYIQVVPALMPVQLVMRIGQLRPLCRTAVGKALLAQHPDNKIVAIVQRINARTDGAERVQIKKLMPELTQIRRDGIAFSINAASPGAAVIAAAVPVVSKQNLPMAIGIGGPVDQIVPRRNAITDILRLELQEIRPA